MDWNQIESDWAKFRVDVKEQWSRLSDHQLDRTRGNRERLAHEIETTYGISKHAAEWQLSGWEARMQHALPLPRKETRWQALQRIGTAWRALVNRLLARPVRGSRAIGTELRSE